MDSVDQIINRSFTDCFPQEERNDILAILNLLESGKGTKHLFKTRGLKNGSNPFPLGLSVSFSPADQGHPSLFLIAARDNSELLNMEEELEQYRRSLALIKQCHQILMEDVGEQIFLDRITSVISTAGHYDLTWYSLEKDDGNLCTGSFVRGDKIIGSARSLHLSSQVMKERKTIVCDNRESFLDNEERESLLDEGYRSMISLPLFADENVIGTLNIYSKRPNTFIGDRENLENLVEDICHGIQSIRLKHKQRELETQLLQAQKMETIGTLAGGIAHDFNNIMTPILGYSEIILHKMSPDDPLYSYNQHIFNGAVRAKELVKQILAFSHKENHKKEPVFLDKIVKEALQLMGSLIPKTISIYKHICHHCGKIMGDSAQIHQVIANLCTNSFQAMEEMGGSLTVELEKISLDSELKKQYPELKPGNYAQLIIADTGQGMAPEVRNRIFEPFYTTKPVGKGTGLGLSVVHGIVSNHNGTIHVESREGIGTLFKILLPLIPEEKVSLGKKEEKVEEGKEEIILLIDDHRDITELLKIMLTNSGYTVQSFNDSQSALNRFKKSPERFSLIITDLFMPEISGLVLLKEIQKKRGDLPAIVITGHEENLTEREKNHYNISEVIHKPILRNTLIQAVHRTLSESDS